MTVCSYLQISLTHKSLASKRPPLRYLRPWSEVSSKYSLTPSLRMWNLSEDFFHLGQRVSRIFFRKVMMILNVWVALNTKIHAESMKDCIEMHLDNVNFLEKSITTIEPTRNNGYRPGTGRVSAQVLSWYQPDFDRISASIGRVSSAGYRPLGIGRWVSAAGYWLVKGHASDRHRTGKC